MGGGGRARRREAVASTIREDIGQDLLLKLFESSDGEVRRASLRVLGATGLPPNAANARKKAAATDREARRRCQLRADSIGLMALDDPAAHEELFKKLIDPKQPEAVQAAAVRALGPSRARRSGLS